MKTYYIVYSKMSHAVYGFHQTKNFFKNDIKKADCKHYEIFIRDVKLKFCSDELWEKKFKYGTRTKPINGYFLERKLDELRIVDRERKKHNVY